MAPTLFTACNTLPSEGAVPPKGGLSAELGPTLIVSRTALPPEGVNFPGGGPSENCCFDALSRTENFIDLQHAFF
jgi:hypothetical protein